VLKDVAVNGYASAEARFGVIDGGRKPRRGRPPRLRNYIYGCLEFIRSIRGTDDAIFVKYSIEAKRLGCRTCPVPLLGAPARISAFYRHATWIVLGVNAKGTEVRQGTAFVLQGVGFLTAAHVFADLDEPVTSWKLVRGIEPFDEFAIHAYNSQPPIDLALLQVDSTANPHAMFVRSDVPPGLGDKHRLLGYQNWKTIADKPMDASAVVVQITKYFASDYLIFGHPLIEGTSGGPVLNQQGKVVGVIATSVEHSSVPNGAIAIHHTNGLISMNPTSLP